MNVVVRAALPVFAIALSSGCKRPAEAPAELDELCAYLYTHIDDDDDEALVAGLENLDVWLAAHLDETLEGYTVENLDQETVNALDDQDRDITGLLGAAVGSDSAFSVTDITMATAIEDQMVVFPDTYNEYERTYVTDEDCFEDRSCDTLEVENFTISKYAGLITVTSENTGQYRWVETASGVAMIQRTWLHEPAQIEPAIAALQEQFYLTVTLPIDNGSRRLQATWMIGELIGASVPEAGALNMIINSMQKLSVDLEAWLEGE